MIRLSVYVPESHIQNVKQAMFAAGGGRVGAYEECCWQTLGTGQFKALPGSNPFIGTGGAVSQVPEYHLEMVCSDEVLADVILAMKQAHPYEEPAFGAWRLLDL